MIFYFKKTKLLLFSPFHLLLSGPAKKPASIRRNRDAGRPACPMRLRRLRSEICMRSISLGFGFANMEVAGHFLQVSSVSPQISGR